MSWNTRIQYFKMMMKYRLNQLGLFYLRLMNFISISLVLFVIGLNIYLGYILFEQSVLLWYLETYGDFENAFKTDSWARWLYFRYAFRAARLKFYPSGEKACLKEIMIFIFTERDKIPMRNRARVILKYLIDLQTKHKINIIKRDVEFSKAYKDLYAILQKFRDMKKK